MNHERIYNQIVTRSKSRNLEGYVEKHHIIPKCMGGTDEGGNLVKLTAREHFICHKLLTEIYPDQRGLHCAVFRMVHKRNAIGEHRDYKIGSREYERLRENLARESRESSTGNTHSDNTKRKLSKLNKGKNNSFYGRKHTDESKKKMSLSKSGKQFTKEHKEKLSKSHMGNIPSEITKQKMKESQLKRWAKLKNK